MFDESRPGAPYTRRFTGPRPLIAALLACALVNVACQQDVESRLTEIRALQEAGQFEPSIAPLRVLLAAEPSHAEANYRLGVALVQTGRPSLAVWPLQKATQSEDYSVQAGLLLAGTLLAAEDYEESIRAVDRVLAEDPDRVAAHYTRARANLGAGRPEDALGDADRLLEIDPDDALAFGIRAAALIDLERFDEAEETHRHLKSAAQANDDPDKAARACTALALFYASRERIEEAEAEYDECVSKYPQHPVVLESATHFYLDQQKTDKALAAWRAAVEAEPENINHRSQLSELLLSQDEAEEAEQILLETVELFDTRGSWQMLSSFYRRTGDNTKAREAIEKAIERSQGDPSALRFAVADLLIAEGEYERAEAIAAELEEPSYTNFLRGSILLGQGDPKGALEMLDSGLRLWPNNAGARFMAGRAAQELGDIDRALLEYREAARVDSKKTDASLMLAMLYYSLGQYTAAAQFAERQLAERPFQGPQTHLVAARAAYKLGKLPQALSYLEDLRRRGESGVALAEVATIVADAQGETTAIEAIEKADVDLAEPENGPVLRVHARHLIAAGRGEEALALTDAALAKNPEDPSVLDTRARVLGRLGRPEEAREYFERATTVDPEYASAIEGLADLAAASDIEKAYELFVQAAALDENNSNALYRAGQLAIVMGDLPRASARFEEALKREPGHVGANNDLAWLLAESGSDLDRSLALADRASKLEPSSTTLDTLGFVQLQRGENAEAAATLERALAQDPDNPSIRYRLGTVLAREGQSERAAKLLEEALAAGSFPEAESARAELARLKRS